jgi:hypothetical protein
MYTNPDSLANTLINLLDRNAMQINAAIRAYQDKRKLNVFKGMRKVLPIDAYPALEIEPQDASNSWATTRAQRPRYTFKCTLTVRVDNERDGVEYVTTLATVLAEIMTSPENLQMRVLGETKWDPTAGLSDTYILDSLVDNATYSAAKEGSIRKAEFSWFAMIHEPYPESKWKMLGSSTPTVIRPRIVPA